MSKKIVWAVLFVAAAVLLALDLLLKYWAQVNLQCCCGGRYEETLVRGLLGLTYVRNHGAFFGFLRNFRFARELLTVLKVVILGVLLWYYHRLPLEKKIWFVRVPIILIVAGGVGNLYDRFRLGYVRDMLDFIFWQNFAIFNLADVYVTIGAFSLAFVVLFVVKDFPL
ncbi:MAG: signal peptidase II [Defluviitaleaceae bacterium]|nr:signal peptidase II [Defluviitaleaceae bacterium]